MREGKLYTFGCSFTKWHSKTWADYLSYFFKSYQNFGSGGMGNRFIFHTIIKNLERIKSNDTVIVQWSGLLRVDYMNEDGYMSLADPYGADEYTKSMLPSNYIKKCFSIEQQVSEFINYSKCLNILFKSMNLNYKFLFMLNPLFTHNKKYMLGEPLSIHGDIINNRNLDIQKALNRNPDMLNELKYEIDTDLYIKESIFEYQLLNEKKSDREDYHPLSSTHLDYCFKNILSELGINPDSNMYDTLKNISIKEDLKIK